MKKFLIASIVGLCAVACSPATQASESPYGKTFTGSANLCLSRLGRCTGVVPIHVYLAKSGRLYSFLRSEGGQMFSLGQYVAVGDAQQRFIVKGNTLVFEDVVSSNNGQLIIRGFMRAQGGQCSVTGSATYNGAPEPSTMQASCEVSEGQH